MAAGTALVGAMATDAWERARESMLVWWGRARPEQVPAVDAQLVELREAVSAAQERGDADTPAALVTDWQGRLHEVLRGNPALAAELRGVLDRDLAPVLDAGDRRRVDRLVMNAKASGDARVYQAGRDQHITER